MSLPVQSSGVFFCSLISYNRLMLSIAESAEKRPGLLCRVTAKRTWARSSAG